MFPGVFMLQVHAFKSKFVHTYNIFFLMITILYIDVQRFPTFFKPSNFTQYSRYPRLSSESSSFPAFPALPAKSSLILLLPIDNKIGFTTQTFQHDSTNPYSL